MIKLVLVRHGQSTWNFENRFTGWTDVGLTKKGEEEADEAGEILLKNGYIFDIAYTSLLKRAKITLTRILKVLKQKPNIYCSWRLNERHYGALQGLNKKETILKYGSEQVRLWRRSAEVRPPALSLEDARHPSNSPLYKDLDKDLLPCTENLLDTAKRVLPYWDLEIKPHLLDGKRIIIVAHGNSLRALVMHLEKLDSKKIMEVEIPTGKPLVYELDEKLAVLKKYYLS
ncbi:2,3-diphosphoglycerate-dependent phosphoglycerate mutase [bacterium]|jgi:2,3-bisphosphoglycerate-dependent phosphoglycerate mutase|nr:2,3-diphosphoglycerate-dependent phosphoglycerate mutase [bacterium]